MESAGRKVVKISRFFQLRSTAWASSVATGFYRSSTRPWHPHRLQSPTHRRILPSDVSERRLLQLRLRIQHQRNVSVAGAQFRRKAKSPAAIREQHRATSPAVPNHDRISVFCSVTITPSYRGPAFVLPRANRDSQLQCEIRRRLLPDPGWPATAACAAFRILSRATRALLQMARERLHLRSAHAAVEIGRTTA